MQQVGAKNLRKCIAIAVVSFAVTLGGLFWWSAVKSPWHSHPDQPRELTVMWSWVSESLRVSDPGPAFKPSTVEFADEEPQFRGKGWWISHDRSTSKRLPLKPYGREIVWANKDGIAQLPNGAGEIHLSAVAFELSRATASTSYVDPLTLTPLDASQVEALLPIAADRNLDFSGNNRPGLRWILKVEGANVEIERMRAQPYVFDARTQVQLGESFADSHYADRTIVVDTSLDLWHDTELFLSCDLVLGPALEFEIPNEPNWQKEFDQFRIQYLDSIPGKFLSYRSGLYMAEHLKENEPPVSSALFVIEPPAFGNLISVSAATEDNETRFHLLNPVNQARLRVTQPMSVATDEIVSMKGRCLPNMVTVIFRLPKIPDMPNPRGEINNLFNVEIPEITLKSGDEMIDLISTVTQMRFSLEMSNFPVDHFPKTYKNVTPRQLLKEWERFHPEMSVVSRPDEFEIDVDFPESRSERFKAWWKDLWN